MTPPERTRLARIEQHYARSPFVGELCVVARAPAAPTVRLDNGHGSPWHALVVPDAAHLRTHRIVGVTDWVRFEFETLSEALAPGDRLNSVVVTLRPLPRTASGDVDRERVAALLAASARGNGVTEAIGQATPDDDVGARVVALATRASGRPSWPGAHLDVDLGLDSIGRLGLVLAIEDALGVALAGAPGLATVGDLIDAARQAPARPRAREAATPWHALLDPPARPGASEAASLAERPWAVSLATYLLLRVIRFVATLAVGLRVSGLAHVPRDGPLLLCPNHDTFVDGFLVSAALPLRTWHRLFFVGASEYYATRASAWFARAIGIVPIDADANLPAALRTAAAGLRAGRALLVFPEGERSIDGRLKRFRPGAALLATTLGVPVVPVHLHGTFAWWPRGHGFAWRRLWRREPRVRLRFGPPLVAGCGGAPSDAAGFAAALRDRVARLALPAGDGET